MRCDKHFARGLFACALVLATGCSGQAAPGAPASAAAYALSVTAVDTRFDTRDHFIASLEMQLSGEPFATAMGRDVGLFNRDYVCQESVCSADGYPDESAERNDPAGFSTGVESYEYSKQPMNNLAFESGAGTSLVFGPLLNPAAASGAAGVDPLARRRHERDAARDHRCSEPARLARAVADAAAVRVLGSVDRADARGRLLAHVRRQSRPARGAHQQHVRVRLPHAEPARP
jgi:hypothetical protein